MEEEKHLINSPSFDAEVEMGEKEIDDGDFEFAVSDIGEPPITADELFSSGRILPIYLAPASPAAKEHTEAAIPLRKLLIDGNERTARSGSISSSTSSEAAEGEYCPWSPEWSGKRASAEADRRRWRIRDLLYGRRSRSDGKDKYGFLEKETPNLKPNPNPNTTVKEIKGKKKVTELDVVTAHRLYYGNVGVMEGKRSLFPSRQQLIGFSRKNYPF